MNIVIIEDNEQNIRLYQAILEHCDYTFKIFRSGEKALDWLKINASTPLKLILLDISLPGINGLEVLKIMRSQDHLKTVPVIAVTATSGKYDQHSFNEVLQKPFFIETIYNLFHMYCDDTHCNTKENLA